MRPRSLFIMGAVSLCLALSSGAFAGYPIEVIELQSRPLDEVLPVVRSMLGDAGTVTGMGSNLVIKASPEQVRAIRKMLIEIDRPPKRLVITVSNAGEESNSSSGYTAGADIKAGDGQVSINTPGRRVDDSRARISVHGNRAQGARSSGQHVQALEGRPAYINAGVQMPVQEHQRYYDGGILHERRSTRMHNVSSGFYVVPRLSGVFVTLEILQHDDRPGRVSGVYDTQRVGTSVSGRLGEWIELGGVDAAGSHGGGGLGRSRNSQGYSAQQIRVRVECLDCQN